ncbi:MAG: hypothetical protein GF398_08690 [Chitinivibrionales bacterium]|nr:hypothetical protein [Chitinivibrionales bacterium]
MAKLRHVLPAILCCLCSFCTRTEKKYYESGALRTRYAVKRGSDGELVKHGPYASYFENGKMSMETHYLDGKEHGRQAAFFENGQKWYECTYEHGRIVGLKKEWHEDGSLFSKSHYVNGRRGGKYTDYHPNGEKAYECLFRNAEKEGSFTRWSATGAVIGRGSYTSGKKHGMFYRWDEQGNLISVQQFDRGNRVEIDPQKRDSLQNASISPSEI